MCGRHTLYRPTFRALRASRALALCLVGSATSSAGTIQLPSDVSVSLTAEPSTGLESWDAITFTVSVTNLGPESLDRLGVSSSFFHDQLDVFSLVIDECEGGPFGAAVVDYIGGYDYYVFWYPVFPSTPALNVGETLTCRFSMALTDTAPAVYPFSFDLGGSLVDLDPSNNIATVVLRRAAPAADATPIPTLSPIALFVLAVLLTGMVRAAQRAGAYGPVRRGRGRQRPR